MSARSFLRVVSGLLLSPLLVWASPAAAQTPAVRILYVAFTPPREMPSTSLLPIPPADEGFQGARLAVAEETATGKFLDLSYDLKESAAPDEEAVLAAARAALAEHRRVLVADLPGPILLRLADLPEAKDALLLDVSTRDDALRGVDCRRNVLHVAPSRAMLADALMQYLTTKEWRRILLLTGRTAADRLYADALRRSAKKFQVKLAADREWSFNASAQQADTGHYQINAEVAEATAGVSYDVVVAADEAGAFAGQVAYRTRDPRPVAGSAGLMAAVWTPLFDEYAAAQLQIRFRNRAHRPMMPLDFNGWMAVRAIGEATVRGGSAEPVALAAFLRGPDFHVAGYKGAAVSFRSWDGQLRQPILLVDERSLVSISPQPGYLHQFNVLDTLGADQPESACRY